MGWSLHTNAILFFIFYKCSNLSSHYEICCLALSKIRSQFHKSAMRLQKMNSNVFCTATSIPLMPYTFGVTLDSNPAFEQCKPLYNGAKDGLLLHAARPLSQMMWYM